MSEFEVNVLGVQVSGKTLSKLLKFSWNLLFARHNIDDVTILLSTEKNSERHKTL